MDTGTETPYSDGLASTEPDKDQIRRGIILLLERNVPLPGAEEGFARSLAPALNPAERTNGLKAIPDTTPAEEALIQLRAVFRMVEGSLSDLEKAIREVTQVALVVRRPPLTAEDGDAVEAAVGHLEAVGKEIRENIGTTVSEPEPLYSLPQPHVESKPTWGKAMLIGGAALAVIGGAWAAHRYWMQRKAEPEIWDEEIIPMDFQR